MGSAPSGRCFPCASPFSLDHSQSHSLFYSFFPDHAPKNAVQHVPRRRRPTPKESNPSRGSGMTAWRSREHKRYLSVYPGKREVLEWVAGLEQGCTSLSARFEGSSPHRGSLELLAQYQEGFVTLLPPRAPGCVLSPAPSLQPVLQPQGWADARGCCWFLFWKDLL